MGLQVPELLAPERAVVVEDGDPLLGRHGLRGASANATIASVVSVSFQERSSDIQWPEAMAASSRSCTWSIVKLAAFIRGG